MYKITRVKLVHITGSLHEENCFTLFTLRTRYSALKLASSVMTYDVNENKPILPSYEKYFQVSTLNFEAIKQTMGPFSKKFCMEAVRRHGVTSRSKMGASRRHTRHL